jgi:hypothetical protein
MTWTLDFFAYNFAAKQFVVIVRTAVLDGPKSGWCSQDQHEFILEINDFLFVQWKIG